MNFLKLKAFLLHVLDYVSYKYPRFFLNDKFYIKLRWKFQNPNTYTLNLEVPETFNEKLNWLKLHDHNSLYSKLVDKYQVKNYVANCIGAEYVVPSYGVYESFDDIDFNKLPNQFVLKSTHDSSGAVICVNKKSFDIISAKKHFKKSLSRSWFWPNREWAYKYVKPRIVVEQYLYDKEKNTLLDYKFWCFNGVPKYMYITNKSSNITENFYDMDFNPVGINHGFRRENPEFVKPQNFDNMVNLARQLSAGFPFVRKDFFYVDKKIYFGEYTFYDWGGLKSLESYEQDKFLGTLINLSN